MVDLNIPMPKNKKNEPVVGVPTPLVSNGPSPAEALRLQKEKYEAEQAERNVNVHSQVQVKAEASAPSLTTEQVLAWAKANGMKIEAPKRVYNRHTVSMTDEHKKMLKQYAHALGTFEQDALHEALEDFFQKHQETHNYAQRAPAGRRK